MSGLKFVSQIFGDRCLEKSTTVEPVLKDAPIGHKNVVSQDRWSLVTGSVALKCGTLRQEYVVLQDQWSLMAVVSQDRFHYSDQRHGEDNHYQSDLSSFLYLRIFQKQVPVANSPCIPNLVN